MWAYESTKAIQTLGVVTYDTSCDPAFVPPPEPEEEPVVVEEPIVEVKEQEVEDEGLTTG